MRRRPTPRSEAILSANTALESPQLPVENDALLEAVRVRKSIRNYEPVPLRPEHVEKIRGYLDNRALMRGALGKEFRLALLLDTALKHKEQVGTYGFIKNPPGFVVGISKSEPLALFEIAYVFHGLILYLTHLRLGTVWIGGTFNQDDVRRSVHVGKDEIVPAISPVGYAKRNPHFKERLQRTYLGATNRRPIDEVYFFGGFDEPLGGHAPPYHRALDLARRAPSAKNMQPWRVVVSRDLSRVYFYVAFSLKGEVGNGKREYACPPEYLDLGAFYRSFEVAVAAEGVRGSLEVHDPGLPTPPDQDLEYLTTWVRI
jgi:nitroreductase